MSRVSFRQQCVIVPEHHALLPKAYKKPSSPPEQIVLTARPTDLIIRSANATLAAGIHDIPELFEQQYVFIGWLFHIGSKLPKSIDYTPTLSSAL